MVIAKKAKRFVKYLAKNLNEGGLPSTSEHDLKNAFQGAVDNLPDGELLQEFKDNFKSYFEKFRKLCLSHVATMSSAEESMETDTTVAETVVSPNDVSTAVPTYPYNLFSHKPNRVSIPESCSQQEKKEIYLCFLSKKIGVLPDEKVLRILDDIKGDHSQSKLSWLEDLQFLSNLLLSHQSSAVLYKIMMITSKKLLENVDSVLSGKKCAKKSLELSSYLSRLLYLFHRKHEALDHPLSQCSPSYADLMAAMLSVYVDLTMTAASQLEGKEREREAKRLCVYCGYLLHRYPFYVTDVLAQLGGVTPDTADVLHPLIRKTLVRQTPMSCVDYTKYMCTLRLLEANTALPEDVMKHVSQVVAPADYLTWLEEQDGCLLDEMPVTKQFHGNAITRFLLEVEMELINVMMECVTAGPPDGEVKPAEEEETVAMETTSSDAQAENGAEESEPLFFIDKKGDKEDSVENGDDSMREESDVEIDDAELDRLMKSSDESDQEDVSSDAGGLETDEEPESDDVPLEPSSGQNVLLETEDALNLVLENASAEEEDMISEEEEITPQPPELPSRQSPQRRTTSGSAHDEPKSPEPAKPASQSKRHNREPGSPDKKTKAEVSKSPARGDQGDKEMHSQEKSPTKSSAKTVQHSPKQKLQSQRDIKPGLETPSNKEDQTPDQPRSSRRRTHSNSLSVTEGRTSLSEDATPSAAQTEESQEPQRSSRQTRSKQRTSVGKLNSDPAADSDMLTTPVSGKKRKSGGVNVGVDAPEAVKTRSKDDPSLVAAAKAVLSPERTPPALRTVHLRTKKLGPHEVYDFHSDTDSPMARAFQKKTQPDEFKTKAIQKAATKSAGIISHMNTRTRTSSLSSQSNMTLRTRKVTDEDEICIPTPTRVTSPPEELLGSSGGPRTRKRTSSKSPMSREEEQPLKRVAIDESEEGTTGTKSRRKSRGTSGEQASEPTPQKNAKQDDPSPAVRKTRQKTPIKHVDEEVSFNMSPGKVSAKKTPASAKSTRRRSGAVKK